MSDKDDDTLECVSVEYISENLRKKLNKEIIEMDDDDIITTGMKICYLDEDKKDVLMDRLSGLKDDLNDRDDLNKLKRILKNIKLEE